MNAKAKHGAAVVSSDNVRAAFTNCNDFVIRRIHYGLDSQFFFYVCWLDGVVSGIAVAEDVLRPLTQSLRAGEPADEKECLRRIASGAVYSYSVKHRDTLKDVLSDLSHGHCAILFDSLSAALCFEVRGTTVRSVSEPTLEKSLKGGKDSFVETLRINTALIRRRIGSPSLKLTESSLGRKSQTNVSILYMDGIANPQVVEELARRLDTVDVDALLATGPLEEAIADRPRSLFPQVIHTERPDRFSMYLMDGRVGLLIDGIPVGLIVPVSLAEFMKVTGDRNLHFLVSTALRCLRYLALLLSLLLPAVYVAITMYHQEMIPEKLLLSIIDAKQNVPFTTAMEMIFLLLAFGFLQEAGLRLPNPIGDTVSIIGALIVGQSAVEAQLVSPIAIIVVAVSGIAGYTLPSQDLGAAVRLLRVGLLLAAITTGLYGLGLACCGLLLYLAGLDSFGTDYTAPLSDGRAGSLLRLLFQIPQQWNKYRDPILKTADKRRQK